MPNEIARYEGQGRGWVDLMGPAAECAKTIANTDFVPRALRGNVPAITAAILYGDEVGLGPMQSLAKVHVIEGRPALAAEAQRALILSQGHRVWLEEATNTRVTWCGQRAGDDNTTRITWTMDDAKRAKLDGRQNWRNYPRAMLSARASAELARAVFADVIGGLGAIEELDDDFIPAGTVIVDNEAAPPAAPTAKRKRAGAKPKPAPTPAERVTAQAPPEADLPPLPGDEAQEPAPSGGTLPFPNWLAMKFKERGFTEEARHHFVQAVSEGRTEHASELEPGEVLRARDLVNRGNGPIGQTITDYHGEAVRARVLAEEAQEPDPEPAGPDLPDDTAEDGEAIEEAEVLISDGADLKAAAQAAGKRVSDVIRWTEGKATSLDAIVAAPELLEACLAWLKGAE